MIILIYILTIVIAWFLVRYVYMKNIIQYTFGFLEIFLVITPIVNILTICIMLIIIVTENKDKISKVFFLIKDKNEEQ